MLELEHGFRVFDVHARLDADRDAVAVRGRNVTPERLEREMHQAGIVRAAVIPGERPAGEGYLRANNAVARLSVDRPFLAFARLDGPRSVGGDAVSRLRSVAAGGTADHHATPEDVEQYAYDDRFHGFALVPGVDGVPTEAVLERLEAVGAPLLVRSGPDLDPTAAADRLFGRGFPVVLSSFGGYPLDGDRMRAALSLLDDHDDLYLDTCAVRRRDLLERGLLEHPDRIVFGSGAPEVHPDVGVMELLTLDVPADAMRRALSKNPVRVIPAFDPEGG